MALEIERKYLVRELPDVSNASKTYIRQGYLSVDKERVVRVRIFGERAYLTVKGQATGYSRPEYEYEIPLSDAMEMLENLCFANQTEKTRYEMNVGAHTWVLDEFHGANEGLLLAEIELKRESEEFEIPSWLGKEVTSDYRYSGAKLMEHPYTSWKSK